MNEAMIENTLTQQIKTCFLNLQKTYHKGFLISYTDDQDNTAHYYFTNEIGRLGLYRALRNNFEYTYTTVVSILNLAKPYEKASISTKRINKFINKELNKFYKKRRKPCY